MTESDRPEGAQPPGGPRPNTGPKLALDDPANPSDGPPKLTYATAMPASRLRIREIWSGPFREALAEMAAERTEAMTRAA
jgi:hypothetical protein